MGFFDKIVRAMSGLKVGDIDIGDQVIDNEFRIKLLTRLVEWIVNRNRLLQFPSQEEIKEIRDQIIKDLKEKYPKSGVEYNEDKK